MLGVDWVLGDGLVVEVSVVLFEGFAELGLVYSVFHPERLCR